MIGMSYKSWFPLWYKTIRLSLLQMPIVKLNRCFLVETNRMPIITIEWLVCPITRECPSHFLWLVHQLYKRIHITIKNNWCVCRYKDTHHNTIEISTRGSIQNSSQPVSWYISCCKYWPEDLLKTHSTWSQYLPQQSQCL